MNKATFERGMKAVATGKPLKEIRVISEDGIIYDIKKIGFDSANDCIWLSVVEAEES